MNVNCFGLETELAPPDDRASESWALFRCFTLHLAAYGLDGSIVPAWYLLALRHLRPTPGCVPTKIFPDSTHEIALVRIYPKSRGEESDLMFGEFPRAGLATAPNYSIQLRGQNDVVASNCLEFAGSLFVDGRQLAEPHGFWMNGIPARDYFTNTINRWVDENGV